MHSNQVAEGGAGWLAVVWKHVLRFVSFNPNNLRT
jgi:hypothetical protein